MTDARDTSRVLTLVFTDLADSTALKTERGDVAVGDLISRHREHVTRIAAESSGRIIDWAGDGCFLTFETSSAAVLFALRLQQAHADESDLPAVRIGVHMGEVTEKPGPGEAPRIEGLAVDIAARISGLTRPGQVLMSASVYNSARQRIGVDAIGQPILWQLHGSYSLKGFDAPMDIGEAGVEGMSPLQAPESSEKAKLVKRAPRRPGTPRTATSTAPRGGMMPMLVLAGLLMIAVGAIAYLLGKQGGSESPVLDNPITSIAVLPFDNLMGDPEQEYFVDGMTEAIIAELAKIKALKVISRTSVMQYKGTTKTMPEIASELGVEGLIEGSIFRSGDEVRITAQLIDGTTDLNVWAESYEGTLENILKLQGQVAMDIAQAIQVAVTPEEETRITAAKPVDPQAYEAYLRGMFFYWKFTPSGFQKSVESFQRAVELDPGFAQAYAWLGAAHWAPSVYGFVPAALAEARTSPAVNRALALDDTLADAHIPAGWIALVFRWDWARAEREFRRAIKLNPGLSDGHNGLAWYYASLDRFDDASREVREAIDLDPLNLLYRINLANTYTSAGRHQEAIAHYQKVLDLDPVYLPALMNGSLDYIVLSRYQEAVDLLDRGMAIYGRLPSLLYRLVWAHAAAGRKAEAEALLAEIHAIDREEYVAATYLAVAYAALGDMDEAFRWVDQAIEDHDFILINPYWPDWHLFRSDPRFIDVLRQINYPAIAEFQAAFQNDATNAEKPIKKIAVLPFENMSSDPEQEYFVDGMTEALIAELAKIRSIKVISRTSAMRYKDTDKPLPQIARELGVDALIEGSVLKAGNEVRITAQLIHGRTDEHLWAESYNGTLESVLSLQSQVALAIAGEIEATVTPAEASRFAAAKVISPKAHEAYLRGRHFWWKRKPEDLLRSAEYFEEAVRIDPNYALGHAGLADAYNLLAVYQYMDAAEGFAKAKASADTALALDETLAEAYAARGYAKCVVELDWEGGLSDLRKSIEYNPNFVQAYFWYADISARLGRDTEARSVLREGLERDRLSALGGASAVNVETYSGNYDAAIEKGLEAIQLYPDFIPLVWALGTAFRASGKYDEAIQKFEHAASLSDRGSFALGYLGQIYGLAGERQKALDIIAEIGARDWNQAVSATALAMIYLGLGDYERSLDYLEETPSSGQMIAVELYGDPVWDPLRDDPRFQRIYDRMNYPDPRTAND